MTEDRTKQHLETQSRYSRGRAVRRPAKPGTRQARSTEDTAAEAGEALSPAPEAPAQKPKKPRKPFRWDILGFLLVFAGLAAVTVSLLRGADRLQRDLNAARESSELLDEMMAPVSCEVRYLVANREDTVETVPYGETVRL
ncbi:MAG: hypothetical protein IJI13_10580, partial [Oscillospiraceae bacterium]|nr:hypothetical protein [Oscillospiraceae bacterium]